MKQKDSNIILKAVDLESIYDWMESDSQLGEGNGTPAELYPRWTIGRRNKQVVEWIVKATKN